MLRINPVQRPELAAARGLRGPLSGMSRPSSAHDANMQCRAHPTRRELALLKILDGVDDATSAHVNQQFPPRVFQLVKHRLGGVCS